MTLLKKREGMTFPSGDCLISCKEILLDPKSELIGLWGENSKLKKMRSGEISKRAKAVFPVANALENEGIYLGPGPVDSKQIDMKKTRKVISSIIVENNVGVGTLGKGLKNL